MTQVLGAVLLAMASLWERHADRSDARGHLGHPKSTERSTV
jgi:hypothetical protein